jgi:hypothetical protein
MSAAFPARYASPSTLRAIDPDHLVELLRPHRKWLTAAGVSITVPTRLDYEALSRLLMSPEGMPADLVEAICVIGEMSSSRHYDRLFECAVNNGITLQTDLPPQDLVVRLILGAPEALQRLRLELTSLRPRRVDRYLSGGDAPPRLPSDLRGALAPLERSLRSAFRRRSRGSVAEISPFEEPHGVRLMIRRGDSLRAQPVIGENNASRRILLRPELYDVVRYDGQTGDLCIHAKSVSDIKDYCSMIGEHLFDDPSTFDPVAAPPRYTLEPIREHGVRILDAEHIDGIDSVRLTTLCVEHPTRDFVRVTFGPDDAFAALEIVGGKIHEHARLTRAVFKIQVRGDMRERTVVIAPPITSLHDRDDVSSAIESFIEDRCFLMSREESLRSNADPQFTLQYA